MSHFVVFWDALGDYKVIFIVFVCCLVIHIINMVYKTVVLTAKNRWKEKEGNEGVSVIITCSNKADLLAQNLEAFLNQDYPCFEVIVVDECSEDETQEVLSELQKKYPHLKTSRISPETKFRRTKKLAIHIGVLAAQYDILLFSEINSVPATRYWIQKMQAAFDSNTAVVIGLANYSRSKKSQLWRYFRFLWFWRTVLLIRNDQYVVGNGYNMGYRKKYYIEKKGYSGNTQEYIGYDTEMVKALSSKGEVRIVKEEEANVLIVDDSRKTWEDDYSYYYALKERWGWKAICITNVDFIIEALLYMLITYLIYVGVFSWYLLLLFFIVYLFDFSLVNICLKSCFQRKLYLISLKINAIGFLYKWHYAINSKIARKKWK